MKYSLFFLLLLGCASPPPLPHAPSYVTTAIVSSKQMPIYLEYVGHVEANQSVSIRAQVTGLIMGQYFIEGQPVKKGDLLVTIDERPFLAQLAQAEGELAQNLASLRQAKDTATRYEQLLKDEYVSQLDYDQFVTNVYTGEALVQQSLAAVETARINLDYCRILAPCDGVTSNILIYPGNYVPVGGSPLLTINQICPIRVSFNVPERDLPKIMSQHRKKQLQAVTILQGRPIEGELFLIDNQVDENTGTILLQALYANKDALLWPGEFVDVKLILEVKDRAIVIPSQAIQIGQEGHFVYVVKADRTVEYRKVSILQQEDQEIILNTGVIPGETIVLEGQVNLSPGQEVSFNP